MARRPPSGVSVQRVLDELRLAARKGDRTALSLALDQMRTLAHSPRYWRRYLLVLKNPLARLVDLLVIKQGERIAHQKGGVLARSPAAPLPAPRRPAARKRTPRPRPPRPAAEQPSLFD